MICALSAWTFSPSANTCSQPAITCRLSAGSARKSSIRLRDIGLTKGFMEVAAGPLVRSSYRADKVFEKNNLGLAAPVPVPGQQVDNSLIPTLNLN